MQVLILYDLFVYCEYLSLTHIWLIRLSTGLSLTNLTVQQRQKFWGSIRQINVPLVFNRIVGPTVQVAGDFSPAI